MRTKAKGFALLTVLAIPLLAWGCDDDSPPMAPDEVPLADFAGTWVQTKWEYTTMAGPDQSVDLIAMGYEVTLTIDVNGRFDGTVSVPGPPPGVLTVGGDFTIDGDRISIINDDLPGQEFVGTFALAENNDPIAGRRTTLIMTFNDSAYDFDGDGQSEPAMQVNGFERS